MFKGWGGGFLHYCIDTVLLKFKQVYLGFPFCGMSGKLVNLHPVTT